MKLSSLLWLIFLSCWPQLFSWAVTTGPTQVNASTSQVTQTQTSQEANSQNQRFIQSQWGLTDSEWQRYQLLMGGIRGSVSQANLSPLEALGIHAETEQERRDYAKRLAIVMHDDTERVLAFAKAYQAESVKLYPQTALIDKSLLGLSAPPPTTNNALQSGDRVLFFTRLEHCAACKTQLAALVKASQQANVQLDVYVIDANNDDAIRTWATKQSFDRKRLANKTLTLNHDQGTLTQLAGASATAPLSLLLRGTTTLVLNPSSLP
jgi:integrating conjugative element protein (TIGR03759 family)